MTIETTAAKIGRSMKKRENMAVAPTGLSRGRGRAGAAADRAGPAGFATTTGAPARLDRAVDDHPSPGAGRTR